MKVVFDERKPVYLQIVDDIKSKVAVGRLSCNNKLPSVREMAVEYDVNPNTMQRAYRQLEYEGVCRAVRGTGTFVLDDKSLVTRLKQEMSEAFIESFLHDMEKIGLDGNEVEQAVSSALRRSLRIRPVR